MKKKIIIAGGTGFIGQLIARKFLESDFQVVVLTRGKSNITAAIKYVRWDAKTLSVWVNELEACDVLINLTGKSVDCKYTEKNKAEILNSRVDSTHILGEAIETLNNPPKVWFNSSTATIYEHSLSVPMDEEKGIIGNDFSMSLAKAWEKAFYKFPNTKTRKIALRISIVLGREGGAVPVFNKLVSCFLGGKQGSGKQKFSWIHQGDLLRIIDFCIENKNINGPINCVSPGVIDNSQFMKAFRRVKNIRFGLATPKLLLKIGAFFIRTEPELILKSRYVVSKRLLDFGFEFKYPELQATLGNILNNFSAKSK